MDNNRPISILPAISKVFEKVIYIQLLYGVNMDSKNCSPLNLPQLNWWITYWNISIKAAPIYHISWLKQASDTIDHEILLYKLGYYGINGPTKELFSSFLTNRKQYVQMNGNYSYKSTISTGVPQGSIHRHLLFIIYVNDMSSCSNLFLFQLYAHDTTILSTLQLFETSESPGHMK